MIYISRWIHWRPFRGFRLSGPASLERWHYTKLTQWFRLWILLPKLQPSSILNFFVVRCCFPGQETYTVLVYEYSIRLNEYMSAYVNVYEYAYMGIRIWVNVYSMRHRMVYVHSFINQMWSLPNKKKTLLKVKYWNVND